MDAQLPALPWTVRWTEVEGAALRSGGQGSIRKVREKSGGRLGALKELLPESANNSERRLRMKQEVLALTKVRGDGVPEVLDSNAIDAPSGQALYLVQAWVEGETLGDFVKGPQSIDQTLDLSLALARIVEHCHERGVLHRDIKPENIMIDRDGGLHLVDFGIAWLPLGDRKNDPRTKLGQELGNRFIRLPEMASGRVHDDARSDVTFVVGIIFYLLTGERPRSLSLGESGEPAHRYFRQKIPVDARNDPRMGRLDSIFDIGFQVAPALRFQTITALIDKLEEIRKPLVRNSVDRLSDATARFQEMMLDHETRQRHLTLMAMKQAATDFEQRIRKLCSLHDLEPVMHAGSPLRENDMWVSVVQFQHATGNDQVQSRHQIQMIGPEIVCMANVDGRGHGSEYYRGAVADISRLDEEVARYADIFFAAVLTAFVDKEEARRKFMNLFQY